MYSMDKPGQFLIVVEDKMFLRTLLVVIFVASSIYCGSAGKSGILH
jgi:hypothetical protein